MNVWNFVILPSSSRQLKSYPISAQSSKERREPGMAGRALNPWCNRTGGGCRLINIDTGSRIFIRCVFHLKDRIDRSWCGSSFISKVGGEAPAQWSLWAAAAFRDPDPTTLSARASFWSSIPRWSREVYPRLQGHTTNQRETSRPLCGGGCIGGKASVGPLRIWDTRRVWTSGGKSYWSTSYTILQTQEEPGCSPEESEWKHRRGFRWRFISFPRRSWLWEGRRLGSGQRDPMCRCIYNVSKVHCTLGWFSGLTSPQSYTEPLHALALGGVFSGFHAMVFLPYFMLTWPFPWECANTVLYIHTSFCSSLRGLASILLEWILAPVTSLFKIS